MTVRGIACEQRAAGGFGIGWTPGLQQADSVLEQRIHLATLTAFVRKDSLPFFRGVRDRTSCPQPPGTDPRRPGRGEGCPSAQKKAAPFARGGGGHLQLVSGRFRSSP